MRVGRTCNLARATGVSARVVPAADPRALATAIRWLWQDASQRERLVRGGRTAAEVRGASEAALLAVIQSLSVLPGRKTLVYLSEGLPASPAMHHPKAHAVELITGAHDT